MDFESEKSSDILILKVNTQRATFKKSDGFRDYFLKNVDGKFLKVIIDLSRCEFMDSSFLGIILYITKKVKVSGGKLTIFAVQSDTTALLELTGVSKLIETYDTLEKAKKSFN